MILVADDLFESIAGSFPDTTRMSSTTGDSFLRMYCKRDAMNFVRWNQSEANRYFVTQGRKAAGQGVPLGWSLQPATERR